MMILLVFEGEKREPHLFNTIKALFPIDASVECCYGSNIYNLYRSMKSDDASSDFDMDIVAVLQEIRRRELQKHSGDVDQTSLRGLDLKYSRNDFPQVFLFFDLDCQNRNPKGKELTLQEQNEQLKEMLSFFDNETEHGKLYVNYPMIEALQYTKHLPDADFSSYTVKVSACNEFKTITRRFSGYGNFGFIASKIDKPCADKKKVELTSNWRILTQQHAIKANMLCEGINAYPERVTDIEQYKIFAKQREMMEDVSIGEVSILASFPLFLVDYFGLARFKP